MACTPAVGASGAPSARSTVLEQQRACTTNARIPQTACLHHWQATSTAFKRLGRHLAATTLAW